MRLFRFLFVISLLLVPFTVPAQISKICGVIKDSSTGAPIAGVIVKANGSFTSSDRDGRFCITPKGDTDSISFRIMGYEPLLLPISSDMSEVRLNPKVTHLNDVIIEAPDIFARGDTLVFNVSRYANAKDNAIIDVIKRLPGIKVEKDGTIKYQGKPINKFYLDGNDFIDSQYGLATNNISYKDVKSVEIMENHQPIKALEGIEFPEEAGINLKLKEDAKSRWVGVAKGALGVEPLLFDASVFTMRLARKIQNMFTLKVDNTGWNPENEIKEHSFDDMFASGYDNSLFPEYISADQVNAPLSEKRTRDNLSWLANGIASWRKGDNSMRLKLNYMADILEYNTGVVTDYFSQDIPTFIQKNNLHTLNHDLSVQFNSETNRKEYFLKDKLTIKGILDNSKSVITGSYDLWQKVRRKSLSACNDLKLVKRNSKKLFTVISRNSYEYRPDRLMVKGEEDAVQSVGTLDFRSTTESQFGRMSRFWKFYVTAGIDLDYHRLKTSLTGIKEFDNCNIYNTFLSKVYAIPQIDYERKGWLVSLKIPVNWMHYSIKGQHDYYSGSSSLKVRKQLTSKSDLSLFINFKNVAPSPYLFMDTPILSDYRNLFYSDEVGHSSKDLWTTLNYRYRNPLKSFFVNASLSYGHTRSSLIGNQIFYGDFIVSSYCEYLWNKNTWQINGGLSKGLGHSRMVVGLDVTGSTGEASSMRNGEVIPYRQFNAGLKPYFKGSLVSWLSLNYDLDYSFSLLRINRETNDYHSFKQNLFVTVIPTDYVDVTFGAEHYLTRFPEGNTNNLVLIDASAVWRVNNKIRLSLTVNNMLDRREYRYIKYGTLSRSEYSFSIRPRSILTAIQYRF